MFLINEKMFIFEEDVEMLEKENKRICCVIAE